jgi:Transposase DDE domain
MLPSNFQAFVNDRPICVLARASLEHLFEPQQLDELFARSAIKQYSRTLLFSSLVEMMIPVVLCIEPSVHAAYRKRHDTFAVSDQAVYDKLQAMELGISAALVADSAKKAARVIDELGARRDPWLPSYRTRILDGNHLAATEHRIKELRTIWEAPLPGTTLVVMDPSTGLSTDIVQTPDGHAQERSLLDVVLALVEARDVWIADRNFCTLKFLFRIDAAQAYFIIRQHGNVQGKLKGKRRLVGEGPTGKIYEQEIQLTFEGETRTFRRVTIELLVPTRDGEVVMHLLTNLSKGEVSGAVVATMYRGRWTIETLFAEVTETLACEINTLCYPKAALFVFSLALLAANAVAVVKASLRAAHGAEEADQLSAYYLALEIKQAHDGMMIALPAENWQVFQTMTTKQFAATLKDIAAHADLARYQKSRRGPKKPPPKRTMYRNGGHVSTHKVLTERKE